MEMTKCPYTGFMGFEFTVKCKCVCHTPGHQDMWLFGPCCHCVRAGQGEPPEDVKVYLIPYDHPINADISAGRKSRIPYINNSLLRKHPELLALITIAPE